MSRLVLSKKYKYFIKTTDRADILEGTTAAGKTTVGVPKFMMMVARSKKKMHILSGLDLGTIEKNIITKDLGILDIFGGLVEYYGNGRAGSSMPHIVYHTSDGDKIIYVLGYDNRTRWKKALGGQYGCLYIDEANIADMDYVREATMRCDYFMMTLNPDDPSLPIYDEYVNKASPVAKYANDTPPEIRQMMADGEKIKGWRYWFFTFDDNAGLSESKKEQIKTTVPKGTKLYKNKILGLRARATGLVFPNFDRRKNVRTAEQVKEEMQRDGETFVAFSCGVDTAYSRISDDTIAFIYIGITDKGRCIVLDEDVLNNRDAYNPTAPSDTITRIDRFVKKNRDEWGYAPHVYIDSADQATITEGNKFLRTSPRAWNVVGAWKKLKIIDRIELQLGWIQAGKYVVIDKCENHIAELESYSWTDDKTKPEDRNDHTINASQYAWIPYKNKIK